jgi:hypothetical protein
MARPKKIGLDYFPFDVDFFEDEKIVCIAGEFGIKGEITAVKLLCAVYRNGYFIEWNDKMKMKMLRSLPGVSTELFDQILNRLVRWGFFDKNLFDSVRVLTSHGIQKRFFEAAKRRKTDEKLPYLLIDADDNGVNVCNNRVNVDNNLVKIDNNVGTNGGRKDLFEPPSGVNVDNNGVNVCNNRVNVDNNPQSKVNNKEIKKEKEKNAREKNGENADKSVKEKSLRMFKFFNEMIEYYHSSIKPVKVLTNERERKLEDVVLNYTAQEIADAIRNAMTSDYLNGRTPRRKIPADFDWIFEAKNFAKIFEGSV